MKAQVVEVGRIVTLAIATTLLLFLATAVLNPKGASARYFSCDDKECVWPQGEACWTKYGHFCCPESGGCETLSCAAAPDGCG